MIRQYIKNITTALVTALWMAFPAYAAFDTKATHAVAMDHETGVVVFDKAAHAPMYPASMTKMMTAHLIFKALKAGEIKLKDAYTVSENAWTKQGSKMFVPLGASVTVDELLHGIVIQSGNDACIVFAEGFAGSEERFAERMTQEAEEIGMKNTVFKNATGWPDPEHITTAYDLAVLSRDTIQNYPEYYKIYAKPEFTYNGIRQYNRNLLLSKDVGVDGVKTGHTEEAGYGITISGEREGRRMEVVVSGLTSEKERAEEALKLYHYAFAESRNVRLGETAKVLGAVPVWYGVADTVPVVADASAVITLPTIQKDGLEAKLTYNTALKAPITKGQKIGTLTITHPTFSEQSLDVFAAADVPAASFFKRLLTNVHQLLAGS
jgi:serine-type D-Ala-D-Ala carboxypeptidase (penicillin-binding protein 5/6)